MLKINDVKEELNDLRLENLELRALNYYWSTMAFAGLLAIVILTCVVGTRIFLYVFEGKHKPNALKLSLISDKADTV